MMASYTQLKVYKTLIIMVIHNCTTKFKSNNKG